MHEESDGWAAKSAIREVPVECGRGGGRACISARLDSDKGYAPDAPPYRTVDNRSALGHGGKKIGTGKRWQYKDCPTPAMAQTAGI